MHIMKLLTLIVCSLVVSVSFYNLLINNWNQHEIKSNFYENVFNLTTCGENAYRRGFGQKVISFSFYEHDGRGLEERQFNNATEYPDYFRGIETNLLLAQDYHPGWIVRLYHDLQQGDPLLGVLDRYVDTYDYFDLCHIHNIPYSLLKGNASILKITKMQYMAAFFMGGPFFLSF